MKQNNNSTPMIIRCLKIVCYCIVSIFLSSCKNDEIEKQMEMLYGSTISFPSEGMIKKDCSLYHEEVSDSCTKLVKYVEVFDCSDCQINQLSLFNNDTFNSGLSKRISIVYIVATPTGMNTYELYSKLCEKRIRGTVYLDTCNAFLQANPHVPENTLFHTFVLDEKDKVVLIGDPFKNKKMERLLLKVIEQESKHRETTETRL